MVVIGYKPWLVRRLGMVFTTLVLVVVGEHGALIFARVNQVPDFTQVPAVLGDVRLADPRLLNPSRGPTAQDPLYAPTVPIASATPGQGERWSPIL
jgi:hypothetical protein